MTSEKLKNQILKEIHDENEGRIVADVADNFGINLTPDQIKAIEVELYQDGLTSPTKLPDGTKVLHLTEKGHDFISKGGYKSAAQKSLEYTVSSSYEKWSKDHFERKKPHEIKAIYQKIQAVLDDLIHKIGVVSDDELKLITAPLAPLYEELYGKVSKENSKCSSIIKDMTTCRKEILPFLKDSLTRIELKINLVDLNIHSKIKAVSEQLYIDGHYKQAVLDAFILLDNSVQHMMSSPKTGKPLMEETFSASRPKITFSSDQNEQQGMMYLYAGSIAGIRNRYSHKTIKLTDKSYALDLLHFASALMRLLDNQSIY